MYSFGFVISLATWNIFILMTIYQFEQISCSDDESRLIDTLLNKNKYQPYSRPVANASTPLLLNITLTLKQIIDLDERNQLLKTNLWLEYYWFDSKLVWNPVSSYL